MATKTKKLSMVRLVTDRGLYAADDRRITDADLVIDVYRNVIKARHGIAGRAATVTEIKNSTVINP